jgi:hypothetical protein
LWKKPVNLGGKTHDGCDGDGGESVGIMQPVYARESARDGDGDGDGDGFKMEQMKAAVSRQ